MPDSLDRQRWRLDVRGRVQGVGFRPWVYRLAKELGLGGSVGNDSRGVWIEVEGAPEALERFVARLPAEAPTLCLVRAVERTPVPPLGEAAFRIAASAAEGRQEAEISPDVAICADCRRELLDPADRRYRYPFINCTNCGPRYAIVEGIPYDRALTTMRHFPMCADCQREYDDPADRRFHAQPNACPVCGPRVWLAAPDGSPLPGDGLTQAVAMLRAGKRLAIKGLGGFHLACRADLDEAVEALREAKQREAKPFALMVADLATARRLVVLDEAAERLLSSWQAPVVLAPKQPDAPVSAAVAPASDTLGVMLPYTPLHLLLFADGLGPLVMTSANPADEPLCAANDEAVRRLGRLVDGLLLHDREIARRVDDSVVIAMPGLSPVPVRRSRGYVPMPIRVPVAAQVPVLAVGGDLKGVICLLNGRDAVLSEHLGELANPAAYRNFIGAIERLQALLRVKPALVAHDLHPGYHSARHARQLGLPTIAIQHHAAHVASAAAEHGLTGPVLGLAADGTGYGTDGHIWGAEILRLEGANWQRLAHLRYVAISGGDAFATDTWRPALAHLQAAFGDTWREHAALPDAPPDAMRLAEQRPGTARTSSLGRLFDAVAGLLGVVARNRYEAEAGMTLEALAAAAPSAAPLPWTIHRATSPWQLDVAPAIRALAERHRRGVPAAELARAFHETISELFADALASLADRERLADIVLTGGCFLNKLLLRLVRDRLVAAGLRIHLPQHLPPGDGGLALGQAVLAAQA